MRKAKTSTDFDTVIKQIEADLSEAEATLPDLEAGREELVFSGSENERAAHAEHIRQAEELVKNLKVALSGACKRRDDAAARELDDQCTKWQSAAADAFKKIASLNSEFYKTAEQMIAILSKLNDEKEQFRIANFFLLDAGRGEMRIIGFYSALAEKLGRTVAEPPSTLRLEGIWPAVDVDISNKKCAEIIELIKSIEPMTRADLKAASAAESKAA